MCNPEQFVRLFAEGWARGEPTLLKILHPEGQMRHPGMARPVAFADAPDYVRRIKSSLPGVRLDVRNWAARGNTVFIEWTMTATVRGIPVTWDGADRMILRDGLAIDGVAYFDTLPIATAADPAVRPPDLMGEANARD